MAIDADILISNAKVLTMDPRNPRAEAVAISEGRIFAVGSNKDLAHFNGRRTVEVDARGRTVLPGFVESHMHIFGGSVSLAALHLGGVKGAAKLKERVDAYSEAKPKLPLIWGIGAGYDVLHKGHFPTRHDLDQICPDRPFGFVIFDGHTAFANTKALELAGLMRGKKLPPGNEIVLDANGNATGELRDYAAYAGLLALNPTAGREKLGLSTGLSPAKTLTETERATDISALKHGLAYCARHGITSLHNMDGNIYQFELMSEIERDGALACRIKIPFHFKNTMSLDMLDMADDMRRRWHSDTITGGFVKVFMDGVIESGTALMLSEYANEPGRLGDPLFSAEQFRDLAIAADKRGLQVAVHAIGDGAVRRTLDGYEAAQKANGRRDSRHRVEHIEAIDPADIPRFHQLGVLASVQPVVAIGTLENPEQPVRARLGENRLATAYAWQTLRDAGAPMSFSSDWPVSPLDPLLGITAAMTHKPLRLDLPRQAQSLMDCLHAFTLGGAYAEHQEQQKGMLKEGYFGDLVVLGGDIEAAAPEEIADLQPVLTICGGRVTYEGAV